MRPSASTGKEEIDFSKESFAKPIRIPVGAAPVVLDLSAAAGVRTFSKAEYTIGKYLERRGIYTTELFTRSKRNIHLGVDIGAPVGTPVFAPYPGSVKFRGFNREPGDYGYCVVTEHVIQGVSLFFLFGHLGRDVMLLAEGQKIEADQVRDMACVQLFVLFFFF